MYEDEFIKEGTRGIANYAMYDMAVYDGKIYLPDSIEIIGRCAFYNNTSLRLVNLPANLKYVGDYAFAGCKALKDVTITADEVAAKAQTIGYELVCGIAPRVPRVYLKNGEVDSLVRTLPGE